jgi:hypothetical protein
MCDCGGGKNHRWTQINADAQPIEFSNPSTDVVLNTSQTWHRLRPGEVRTNCGGCHAHSQKRTEFSATAAARDDCKLWDLVNSTIAGTYKTPDGRPAKPRLVPR